MTDEKLRADGRLLNLVSSVQYFARRTPDRCALKFESTQTTYAQLQHRSNRVANALLTRQPLQSRIAYLDFNASKFFEIYVGALKARCVLVGVNARLAAPEVEYILRDSGARSLFVGAEHFAIVESIEGGLPPDLQIIAMADQHPRWPTYDEWSAAANAEDPRLAGWQDDDIIQLYTSGTTGHPKGVCHTHRTWGTAMQALVTIGWPVFEPDAVNLVFLPLFHVAGFNPACATLASGGCVVLHRKVDPHAILRTLAEDGVTATLLVPAVLLAVIKANQNVRTRFPALRSIAYGASPIAPELLRQALELFQCEFTHFYGLTENLGTGTYLAPTEHKGHSGKLASCGKTFPGLALRIVDTEGRELPAFEIGEIIMKSPWVMREYWGKPEATSATVRDGWLWSGDAGYLDSDGYLYIQDRIKDMIKTGGENVYPAEVENALFGHPAVADVAVIGVPDVQWGEAVKALVVVRPGVAFNKDEILAHARSRIGAFKIPKSIDVVADLPRNASGKILRRLLREPYWAGRDREVS
jgi:acyl-CoA synthetase (AMP-forming)/AMP-acid ligase II